MVKVTAKPTAKNAADAATAKDAAATAKDAAAAKDAKKESKKSKKRSDFEAWAEWCEYKKSRLLIKAVRFQEQAEQWEAKKAGEHLAKADKKLKRIEKLKKTLAALQQELTAAGVDAE